MTHIISKFNQGNKKSDMIAITNYSHGASPHGRTPCRGISVADQPAINLSTFFHQSTRSTCSSAAVALAKVATRLKPFSAFSPSRRVHNHFTKRILNLILNRKEIFAAGKWGFRQTKLRGFRGVCTWLFWMRRQDGDVPS